MRARIFNIMQYEVHPLTGEPLINEDRIKVALAHKSIKRWGYISHEEDKYSERDEANDTTGRIKAGEDKPKHWHIVCECNNAIEVSTIASWFGIPENFVDVPKGHGAFLDCIEYLTHENPKEQAKGKHLYPDELVKASFDFREELNKRAEKKVKYGRDVDTKTKMLYDVLYEGKTLKQCEEEDRFIYMENLEKLKKFRMEYISKQPAPPTRINYYVTGRGGVGKGLICRAIARSLYPQYDDDYDIFFEVGAKGAAFEGYDGQPVIIWNDRRAIDLLQELNGRGNVFNVFDTHPTKQKQNIKYGSVNLCNVINIVNSVQEYTEFLDGLAGEYKDKDGNTQTVEDKGQSYRRFPFMILLHEDDFDMMLNKGFVENTKNFKEYIQYNHIRGNMQKIAERCGANEALAKELQTQAVKPITDKHNEVMAKFSHYTDEEEAIRREFADVGKTQAQIDAERAERELIEQVPPPEPEEVHVDEETGDTLVVITLDNQMSIEDFIPVDDEADELPFN